MIKSEPLDLMQMVEIGERDERAASGGLDGGAMARIGPSSPEFIDTVTPGITEQKEGMRRKRR
jgi:hypothetical protein